MDELTTVKALLGHAGLNPPEQEVERLAGLYRGVKRQLGDVYAVDLGDADLAPVFRAGEL